MLLSILNILPILAALIFGLKFSALKLDFIVGRINLMSNICLYLLLIFMGITIGYIPNFFGMLIEVGLMAGLIAVTTSVSTAIAISIVFFNKDENKKTDSNSKIDNKVKGFDFISYIKDPIQLLFLVGLGFILSYGNFIPNVNYDHTVNILLYLLIFSIGVKLSLSNISIVDIVTNKKAIILAITTILGTYIGALALSTFIDLPTKDVLAISSGFGWYTLSGLLSTKLGSPIVGSIAFLTDLFREVIALLVLPALARSGHGKSAIGICGATAMDVTLPIVEKYCNKQTVTTAFISGAIITLAVPFLIPFFFSL